MARPLSVEITRRHETKLKIIIVLNLRVLLTDSYYALVITRLNIVTREFLRVLTRAKGRLLVGLFKYNYLNKLI